LGWVGVSKGWIAKGISFKALEILKRFKKVGLEVLGWFLKMELTLFPPAPNERACIENVEGLYQVFREVIETF